MSRLITVICLFSLYTTGVAQTSFILSGDKWKYLDNGSDQNTAWYGVDFADTSWNSGYTEFGYGDGDESTTVSYGPDSTNKYITTYFRKTVEIANPSQFANFTLRVKRDDGIIAYVNGVEAYRNNMPNGNNLYNTPSATFCTDDGNTWLTATLASGLFFDGNNTIAVEVHNYSITSSDITFDLELLGNNYANTATRGPYLQVATTSGITIRWRTQTAENSKVFFGLQPGMLTDSVFTDSSVTEHIVQLTGLDANTKYYYSIGSSNGTLDAGADLYFNTLPEEGTAGKYTIWATGDCGTGYTIQSRVLQQYRQYMGNSSADAWILLGDNAYQNCTDNEFQANFFDVYKRELKKTTLWPTPGNHDYYSGSSYYYGDLTVPYYKIFSVPQAGQSGGLPSGMPSYYSYNIGNTHMVSIDSHGYEPGTGKRFYDTTSTVVNWLKNDLAQNTQQWTVVYFHYPPYSKGNHDSDTVQVMLNIRQNILKILENNKVDLVLSGHSHCYERSKLINGHYDTEDTFNDTLHSISTSSALFDNTGNSCPYIKNGADALGVVYAVSGSAGKVGAASNGWPHNAMIYSDTLRGGSIILEIDHNRMDGIWLCDDGIIRDRFTIMKNVNTLFADTIDSGDSIVLNASWKGNYHWSYGNDSTQAVTFYPDTTTIYYVTDPYSCLADTFYITVNQPVLTGDKEVSAGLVIYPNPATNYVTIALPPAINSALLKVFDGSGRLINQSTVNNQKYQTIDTSGFNSGIYLIVITDGNLNSYKARLIVSK